MCVEAENKEDGEYNLTGRRIVELDYFLKGLKEFNDHGPLGCSFQNTVVCGEVRSGLNSGMKLKCSMCNFTQTVWTNNKESEIMGVNRAATVGVMEIGCGFSNLEDLMAIMNIPPMSNTTFQKEQRIVSDAWETTATKEMKAAVEEEKRLAQERGDVDEEGIPFITVVADGSWAKRSYKNNYSSLSGAVSRQFLLMHDR